MNLCSLAQAALDAGLHLRHGHRFTGSWDDAPTIQRIVAEHADKVTLNGRYVLAASSEGGETVSFGLHVAPSRHVAVVRATLVLDWHARLTAGQSIPGLAAYQGADGWHQLALDLDGPAFALRDPQTQLHDAALANQAQGTFGTEPEADSATAELLATFLADGWPGFTGVNEISGIPRVHHLPDNSNIGRLAQAALAETRLETSENQVRRAGRVASSRSESQVHAR